MPIRHPRHRRFDPSRARRILRLVDMSQEDFRALLNRKASMSVHQPTVSAWMTGVRPIPDVAALLLKAIVTVAKTAKACR